MFLNLKGKTALVTGSTAGIGKAIAISLVKEGVSVIINGRREEKVIQTIKEIQEQFPEAILQSLVSDLGTEQGCQKAIEEFSEVDILINNLGIFEPKEYFTISDEEWFKMFEVNIMSGVRLTRWYLNQMIPKKEGRVIFIASEAAIMPSQEMAHYSATKTMQLSLSRSLAELTKGTNVTVNTIMPGSTLTGGVETMLNTLYPNEKLTMEEAERRFMKENRPTSIIQRLIRPEEIAHFVTFLSSPLSSAINGSALRIDGGLVRSVF
ncbi:SDR family oxidoreductase [Heyndrickxia oleronia]|uniref:SDR family NAD(P)-dependent oxidoreductase n=1 Tax=Heyndrickxia oleronia TaxID=38875 RepID=UPI00204268D0|nr:SDR family oxidoreductase [Heyndrickxia oleronia]MCM3453598.1 SDR family oxidoreductase [Heyndrickxia oleronia]